MVDAHYAEEQTNEVEILQSIYPTELEILHSEVPQKFTISIDIEDDDEIRPCNLLLTVEYTETYPDSLPLFEISLTPNTLPPPTDIEAELSDKDLCDLTDRLRELGEECLGMAMVFSMSTGLKEAATQRLVEKTAELIRVKEAKIQKEIEADQAKFIGTQVTRASFLEWKAKFDLETKDHLSRLAGEAGEERARRAVSGGKKDEDKRLTGRQLFEQDRSLAQSDSTFIADGDVAVDASLFVQEDDGLSSDAGSDE
ncbi:rwd domain-containing protein [Coemansia aciculifera]|uniref:Rwd domain-containing protein n=1 Tax=Coemansia aciculifera TaxID=417176 RepID=A0A9W8M3G3_9FUNG|nr:rwd domain-containing protein [Coemansia aciculifera]KAJ2871783.1 rwd domain-containing protein [Coemansia aciculifera]KAJ2883197.1 rwd domain-containing protein [Coemansia aciculifera]